MEIQRLFVARVIYHHRSKQERQVTLIVFRNAREDDLYTLIQSDCCYAEPECRDGSRAAALEQWKHLNRALRSEWFLYDKLVSSDPDFADIS